MKRVALILAALLSAAPAAWAAPPPLAAYANDPAIDVVSLSPSGVRYAYVAIDHGARRLVVSGADGKPALDVGVGTADVTGLDWAGDDHLLVSVRTVADVSAGRQVGHAAGDRRLPRQIQSRGRADVRAGALTYAPRDCGHLVTAAQPWPGELDINVLGVHMRLAS